MDYSTYPHSVVEDIVRLRRRISASGLPDKQTDRNLLIGTWNIKAFSRVHPAWEENPGSPKRNLRALASIAEIIHRLDVVAIQEVKGNTAAIRLLLERFLGPAWGLIVSDVTAGSAGNAERLAFVYDKRRVRPSGLVGEIVLPPVPHGSPALQFARTPYIVGFEAGGERFTLLTAHIKYGDDPQDRLPELAVLSDYTARELRDRARIVGAEEQNLIVLGDFNIDQRGDNPLFQAFVSNGLFVPESLLNLRTTFGSRAKYYDQIAWFMGDLTLDVSGRAGVVEFTDAVYQEMTARQMAYRVSDHFPLWVEFVTDRSSAQMAATLGLDPAMPNALDTVPD